MALGAGKYDEALAQARERCGATSAMLIVIDGWKGPGFSCQSTAPNLIRLPELLRYMADQGEIEADLAAR